LSNHDDDTVENVFQSKFKLRSENKGFGGNEKVEKILEINKCLEVSQMKIKMSILNVAYARRQIMSRNIFNGAKNHNVDIVRNS